MPHVWRRFKKFCGVKTSQNLTAEDRQHLKAAEGWLELSDPLSAFEELEQVKLLHRTHPDVLRLRWKIYNKAGKHGNAFTIAEGLTRLLPDDAEVFIWRSHSALRMQGGGPQQALQLLLDVADNFPEETAVAFDLARYGSLSGNLELARRFLHVAFEVAERNGTVTQWKTRALDDAALENLRNRFGL